MRSGARCAFPSDVAEKERENGGDGTVFIGRDSDSRSDELMQFLPKIWEMSK